MADTSTLLEQALSLPEHDRAELAVRLLESLDQRPKVKSMKRGLSKSSGDAQPSMPGRSQRLTGRMCALGLSARSLSGDPERTAQRGRGRRVSVLHPMV